MVFGHAKLVTERDETHYARKARLIGSSWGWYTESERGHVLLSGSFETLSSFAKCILMHLEDDAAPGCGCEHLTERFDVE